MRWGSLSSFASALLSLLSLTACLDRELVPLNPCLVSNVIDEVQSRRIDKVDILFVIDNSNSMKQEQESLERELPALMRALTSGDGDRDGMRDFAPVLDLHLGVVSTDLGVPGAIVEKCDNHGDDGLLQHAPTRDGCAAAYPSFLSFSAGDDPETLAHDFGCIAGLGTDGCGLEQQLEAPLKALWPSVDRDPLTGVVREPNRIRFLGTSDGVGSLGHGDLENVGFMRSADDGSSILAIVLVTDEEDCSMITTDDIASVPLQEINLRCFNHKEALYPITRYVDGLRALRPLNPDLVLFAAIVGVPEALVSESVLASTDLANTAQREAFYERILNDDAMQERVATPEMIDATSGGGSPAPVTSANLVPSCNTPGRGKAYPPRRIVEVARAFGENAIVQSICQESFAPAVDAIVKLIASKIPSLCLPRALVRDSSGAVDCDIVWELPLVGKAPAGTPTRCSEHTLLEALDPATATRGERCRVPQLGLTSEAAVVATTGTAAGWYYDDFSTARSQECGSDRPQRLTFTEGAQPPNGVKVKLECLDEHARPPTASSSPSSPSFALIGSACDEIDAAGNVISSDAMCTVVSAGSTGGSAERSAMFCHPEHNVCVLGCTGDADCPPSWRCDSRPETIAETQTMSLPIGQAFCASPTCDSDT